MLKDSDPETVLNNNGSQTKFVYTCLFFDLIVSGVSKSGASDICGK